MECHSELVEALGNIALPYRTLARRVGRFQQGRVSTTDEQRGAANADADVLSGPCIKISSGSLFRYDNLVSRAIVTQVGVPVAWEPRIIDTANMEVAVPLTLM
ncbi:hypothetical protein TNCV_45111 [Trichonephila clavipes]|nr:hypothetical protein TNCV_45111 [Trichonephila clavipes]